MESIMIFESTPSADDSFYTATIRSYQGEIVGDDHPPDKTVRQIKIHSPLRANYHGIPFSPSNERFVVLPFRVEINSNWVISWIPIFAFESTNWMPRYEGLNTANLTHKLQGESFKYHYQNIHYAAGTLMRQTEPIPDYIRWLRSLPDPYSMMNHAEIRAIPYASLSPTNIHTLRRNAIEEIYYHAVHELAADLVGAVVEAEAAMDDDYSASFDGAAGYVPPAEPTHEDLVAEVQEAAMAARTAALEYSRLRRELKMKRDPTVPVIRGMWVKAPTADGRAVEPTPADELATRIEVREGTDGCPWPYHVYVNHARAEMNKGTECPITMERLSECKVINVSMNCGHIYDAAAISKWTKLTGSENAPCPACRTPIAGMWQIHVKNPQAAAASTE